MPLLRLEKGNAKIFALFESFLFRIAATGLFRNWQVLFIVVLAGSSVQSFAQNIARIVGLLLADFYSEHGYQALHMRLSQSGIEPDVEMGLQLGVDPLHSGQGRYG